ncbi:post-transcriptional regulator [Rummeliibacillus pycnus]|uniref:post-transcriptional regulator n=1 Tax=Rummeliibacillus pycnus TaxID=101070 RepID=UPI000C99BEB4|nr:post-transcriptional regulator [Rummeliibacillus pycnus]
MVIQYEQLFTKVLPVLKIKKTDFKIEGLKSITEHDIWRFLIMKKWKKLNESDLVLHKVISDIFSLTAAQYMTFTQVEELKSANWFAPINDDELKMLIGNQNSPKILS